MSTCSKQQQQLLDALQVAALTAQRIAVTARPATEYRRRRVPERHRARDR